MSQDFPVVSWRPCPEEPEDFGQYDGIHALVKAGPGIAEGGVMPYCACGWTPDNHPSYTVRDHLADMLPERTSP